MKRTGIVDGGHGNSNRHPTDDKPQGMICEFSFREAPEDTRLAFARFGGVLMVRITTKGETSRWGWVSDENSLYAVWAGQGECIYMHEHTSGTDRILLHVIRGVLLNGEVVDYPEGDRLVFSILRNRDNQNARHLEVDRATTGRQLFDSFRAADAAFRQGDPPRQLTITLH